MMNLIGALLAVNLSLLAREAGAGRRGALAVWAALAFAAPFFTYAELIFPEAPAALLIVYAYRHLRGDGWARSNRAQRLLAALCLAYLPWLHARFLFVVAGLALYGWAQIRSGAPGAWRASAAVYVMPLLVSLGLLA
ncbi:MAG: hypothetical protein HYR71_14430, partial [Chloroflexi bacterium]|nr:hypothetical protein [Chloroflexota bacterium]